MWYDLKVSSFELVGGDDLPLSAFIHLVIISQSLLKWKFSCDAGKNMSGESGKWGPRAGSSLSESKGEDTMSFH